MWTALHQPLIRLALASIVLGGVGFGALAPYLSVIGISRLGLSAPAFAAVMALSSGLGAVASIAIGIGGDQTGRHRHFLIACFATTTLAAGAMAIWPSAWLFLIVHGVLLPIGGTSMTQSFALAGLAARDADTAEATRAQGLALVRAGFSGAYAVTPPLCALAVSLGADILWAYHVMALANLVAVGVVWGFWPHRSVATRQQSTQSPLSALRELAAPHVLLHVGLISLLLSSNFLVNTLMGLLVTTRLGGQEAFVGLIAGIIAAIEIPAMLVAPSLSARFGQRPMIFVGTVLYAAFLIGLWLAQSMTLIWWLLVPAGLGAGIILSLPLAVLQSLLADRPGAGGALISVTNVTAMLIAAGLFAFGAQVTGLPGSAALGAAISIAAALALWRLQNGSAQDA